MRKILGMILTFGICSVSLFSCVQAEEVTDLQTQQQELQNQIKDTSNQLEEVQSELSENLQQVEKLDARMATTKEELEKINQQITELQNSMEKIETKLKIAEESYQKQKDLLDNRLITVYESGDTQYLDVILSSRSVSEFLSNYFLITELATYDKELLEEMEAKKAEIEMDRKKVENTQEQLESVKANQTKTAKILENVRTVRENFIAKLSEQEKELQAQIDECNARFDEINREILAIALDGIDTKYIGGELAWPVPGYTKISSNYGMRYHPILHYTKLHTGVDISAPMGANFIAANDGIVTKAGMNSAYGNMVIIDHGGGVSTLYAHGSEILVQVGQTVKRGEAVLKVGSTGYSTGPHAHFEVRINGVVTDPMPYITNGLVPETQEDKQSQTEE
ncbi:MAG: peptidoglycan DD-metalloendopeptidase family protein [Clostridia bacterium]|nr:peptidoglycan DD-metalloendopeptidase family protein [Clostridia bacterium]